VMLFENVGLDGMGMSHAQRAGRTSWRRRKGLLPPLVYVTNNPVSVHLLPRLLSAFPAGKAIIGVHRTPQGVALWATGGDGVCFASRTIPPSTRYARCHLPLHKGGLMCEHSARMWSGGCCGLHIGNRYTTPDVRWTAHLRPNLREPAVADNGSTHRARTKLLSFLLRSFSFAP